MFLSNLMNNNNLIRNSVILYEKGIILADTFVIDLNTVEINALNMLKIACGKNVELYFMTKQVGRNPVIAKMLCNLGFKGAVAVDYKEALVLMKNNIPLMHVGHIAQVPDNILKKIMKYGVEYITVFSIEKATKISRIAKDMGIIQKISLRIYGEKDIFYKSQQGGFNEEDILINIDKLLILKSIKVESITSFPCFLFDTNSKSICKTENFYTLQRVRKLLKKERKINVKINAPSQNCYNLLNSIEMGEVDIMEPGHSLTGTAPSNSIQSDFNEKISYLYITEITHTFNELSYCLGGGNYFNSKLENALVLEEGTQHITDVVDSKLDAVDYYLTLKGKYKVGSIVIMAFRTQMFTTRSSLAIVRQKNDSFELIGIYDSNGKRGDDE